MDNSTADGPNSIVGKEVTWNEYGRVFKHSHYHPCHHHNRWTCFCGYSECVDCGAVLTRPIPWTPIYWGVSVYSTNTTGHVGGSRCSHT